MGPAPSAIENGAEIGGFVLEERIHRGSMSELWRVCGAPGQDPVKTGQDPVTARQGSAR